MRFNICLLVFTYILKFAGDAMVVVWKLRKTSDNLGIVSARAGMCALEALKHVENLSASLKLGSGLGLHIGLGASNVWGGHIGGVAEQFEFFV